MNETKLQTILGSGGALGNLLAEELLQYTQNIRLVSRDPKKVSETDHLFKADLLKREDVDRAVEGSSVVYITVGFPYHHKTWAESWPYFIEYAIDACMKYDAKMVFFDNIYMYNPNYLDGMDENTPHAPPSKKGKVREQVAKMIMDKVENGTLTALIARCADFYGPTIAQNSMLTETVFKPLSEGKSATWLKNLNYKHSFTYTPDAAKGTALLGNSPEAYKQVWHLPTAPHPPTGREWVNMVAKEMNKKPKMMAVPIWMIKIMGLFIPVMKEMPEMMYQYDRDYVFNSDKFENAFDFKVTPYLEGVKTIVKKDYS